MSVNITIPVDAISDAELRRIHDRLVDMLVEAPRQADQILILAINQTAAELERRSK